MARMTSSAAGETASSVHVRLLEPGKGHIASSSLASKSGREASQNLKICIPGLGSLRLLTIEKAHTQHSGTLSRIGGGVGCGMTMNHISTESLLPTRYESSPLKV